MVRDGYFYGIGSVLAAGVIAWLAPWPFAIPVLLLGAFCLWFFRDPERHIPDVPGVIREVRYQRGKFLNAMSVNSADENEQNIVTVEGEGRTVVFKQIAGLIARRIVFTLKTGDRVARGQRVGLIKFGSRVDVIFDSAAAVQVKLGDHVQGGASILALLPVAQPAAVDSAPREASSCQT